MVARTAYVERAAPQRYPGGACPRGRALRHVARQCLAELVEELQLVEPLASVARLTLEGKQQTEMSKLLGMSEEHLSRKYKKLLVDLFLEKLTAKMREHIGEGELTRDSRRQVAS